MTLRDLLKKKDKIKEEGNNARSASGEHSRPSQDVPEFTIMRTTTSTMEIISPPSFPADKVNAPHGPLSPTNRGLESPTTTERPRRPSLFRKASDNPSIDDDKPKREHRLSNVFGSRSRSGSSTNIPANLPDISNEQYAVKSDEGEAKWEKRATMLVQGTSGARPTSSAVHVQESGRPGGGRSRSVSVADAGGDVNIQEAIKLHEAGRLEQSTAMFGKLADPKGANNALSQVLYGLALRHGWGCPVDTDLAITYLQTAAQNSAEVESLALSAGMKKGGSAKGELVLAIFELAQCFRNGWGVKKDPVAAKQYYETAANLGDTDAMNEVAWCFLEGFGCKKDKFRAAQYLRLAEENGSKTLGNTWIWKDKYNPTN